MMLFATIGKHCRGWSYSDRPGAARLKLNRQDWPALDRGESVKVANWRSDIADSMHLLNRISQTRHTLGVLPRENRCATCVPGALPLDSHLGPRQLKHKPRGRLHFILRKRAPIRRMVRVSRSLLASA